jgi:RNA polymerase sigma-70 factor (ECF subfamily)
MGTVNKPDEFVALWSIHARRVYAYILTLVANWADAEDIFQETSTTLWEKLGEFEPGSDFGAWACRIAYFKALSHSQIRRALGSFDEIFFEAVQAESKEMGDELEARFLALQQCLAKLATRDRELITLRYHRNRTPQEVADGVGRSVAAIYKALRRIHDALFDCIQRQIAREDRS